MPPLKTWFLLHLSVLFIPPTVSEVVESMTQCHEKNKPGFLLDDKNPEVPDIYEKGQIKGKNRYKVICHTYNNVRRFVTLYDTENRIPVLSAYRFTGAEGKPDKTWMMEPQLEDPKKGDKNMEQSSNTDLYKNQAGDIDYNGGGYDRGHLLPSSYAKHQDDKSSTFTLTNIVPQNTSFNQGSWSKMEKCVKCIMKKLCINHFDDIEGYVMIGAKPSEGKKIKTINNRVNVPSWLWSAFCCRSKNLNKWIAGAHWGDNVGDRPGRTLPMKTLQQLYEKLESGAKKFEAFPGPACPRNKTVKDLDPETYNKCKCGNNP